MVGNVLEYIPLDFIKAEVRGINPNVFFNNPLLDAPKSIYKGELLTQTIFKYKNITIKIFSNNNRIVLSGSLHTLSNNGQHNYNDFSKTQFKAVIMQLYEVFNITPKNLYIIQLEWSFNIVPPKPSNYIIDGCIQHKSVNKTDGIDCPTDGKYIQFKHAHMILKIYNKALQNKLPNEILRIEIKQTNWSKYRLQGIITLADFINAPKNQFLEELIKQWKSVIFYDLKPSHNDEYLKYQSKVFWSDLRANKTRKTVKDNFDKLKQLNALNGFNTQNKVSELIIKKSNEFQL